MKRYPDLVVIEAFRRAWNRYHTIHGPLLTKGLSFSFVFAAVPLLFMAVVAGAYLLTPGIVALLEREFLGFLPLHVRTSLVAGIERFSERPGSLSVVTVFVFLMAVNNLFFDIHRAATTALGSEWRRARERVTALVTNALFLAFLYGATLASATARWIGKLLPLPPLLVSMGARAVSTVLVAVVIYAVCRTAARRPLRFGPAALVALAAATLWQTVLAVAGVVVQLAGRRFVAYGVLAWAIVFLMFMRAMAEILLHAALLVRELALPDGDD